MICRQSLIQVMARTNVSIGSFVMAALALTACAQGGKSTMAQAARVGAPAPDFSEASIPGPTLSLESLRGKAIYLNFFATWCPPCNEEAPAINALQRQYAASGLQVVGVDVLESARKAALFRQEHHLLYPAVVDQGTLRDAYRVNGLPVHVFIDRQGIVRNIVIGELSPAAMRADVERILR
jgi:cytochrome c biogenesis protein CcmG, thiol:disulfide interchange protein DsbE